MDERELSEGIKVERKEHVDKNPDLDDDQKDDAGQDIALDHLKEDDKYYTNLAEMERKAKEGKKEQTKQKKILKQDVGKSVIKERKLQTFTDKAEEMVKIREDTNAAPREMKTTRGQLKAYSRKLAAEKKKNQNLLRASKGLEKGGFKEQHIKDQESRGKDPTRTPDQEKTHEEHLHRRRWGLKKPKAKKLTRFDSGDAETAGDQKYHERSEEKDD